MKTLYILIVLLPLLGSIAAGLFSQHMGGRSGAHKVTITGVGLSFLLSLVAYYNIIINHAEPFNEAVYTWLVSDGIKLNVGFLIDELSVTMMVVVTFVSWMVHIYTIGYMHDDPGYERFFSYISLFTFSMLMLVMANNFMQLFFGWEAVGLVSYLLIGFWYKKESAIVANMKAFLVNRVGDLGFLLGIAAVLMYTNTLDYSEVFSQANSLTDKTISIFGSEPFAVPTIICILLFVGAMGKSAQVPLHVWLPDSMEGPTPISALIHAATMVTAGIFMVSRMSPLFELSEAALNFVLIIGAITAFFMGLLGLVQHDIKRVVAYSTLSQLGYMTVALGASAYSAAIFHLATHAFFKALLFLAAGSVIIGMHHEQDMRKMGGLSRHMPITWITMLIGTLALTGFPGFAGFYSKDAIIEAVGHSKLWAAGFAYYAVLLGVFVTSLYSYRLLFMVFHGQERMDHHTLEHLHESPSVVTGPLITLAIPSIIIGAVLAGPMLFEDYFADAIVVRPEHQVLEVLGHHYHGWLSFALHGFMGLPFILALLGAGLAYYCYILRPELPGEISSRYHEIVKVLDNKYWFDDIIRYVFAEGARVIGWILWRYGDEKAIDGLMVNGSAKGIWQISSKLRVLQSGYLYHYAFAMIIGLVAMIVYFVFGLRV